jgi:glutaredoxin
MVNFSTATTNYSKSTILKWCQICIKSLKLEFKLDIQVDYIIIDDTTSFQVNLY